MYLIFTHLQKNEVEISDNEKEFVFGWRQSSGYALHCVRNSCTKSLIFRSLETWCIMYNFFDSSLVTVNFQTHLYTAQRRFEHSKMLDHLWALVVGDEDEDSTLYLLWWQRIITYYYIWIEWFLFILYCIFSSDYLNHSMQSNRHRIGPEIVPQ